MENKEENKIHKISKIITSFMGVLSIQHELQRKKLLKERE